VNGGRKWRRSSTWIKAGKEPVLPDFERSYRPT
jgi:hypothetical protein